MKYYRLIAISCVLILLNVGFQNCAKKAISNEDTSASAQAVNDAKAVDLLSQKCASCHSGSNAYLNVAPGSDPITDITNVDYLLQSRLILAGEPDLSPLYEVTLNAEMPPGQPLSVEEITLLKNWITDFNKEDTPTGTGIPTIPLAATFNSLKVNVFLSKCYSCHATRGVKLDTYASVSGAVTNNNLRGRVSNGTMPPNGAPPLSSEEKTAVLGWIDAGAMNN